MTDQVAALLTSLSWYQPELWLAGFALVGALVGAFAGDRAMAPLSWAGAAVFVVAGALALHHRPDAAVVIFNGSAVIDGFGAYAKALIAFSAAATLLLGAEHFGRGSERRFEFPILTALAVLGMFVMISANDLLALYIGVELQSLAAYVMAAYRRDDARSSEAGLKYFVLGALSSGLLLYGASLVYGFTGSVQFADIAAAAPEGGAGLTFGLVFLICGLAFKLGAAPFHMWTPDVYEGAPTPVVALFAAAPKAAAVALLARVLYDPFAGLTDDWRQVVVAIAALSLLVGSFGALLQTNLKRLMAYSSIANMGFVLMGMSAGGEAGAAAALLYLTTYLPATIGVFAIVLAMRRNGEALETMDDLSGLGKRSTWMALVLTVLFFSLMGIPPLAGFFGKWFVFEAALGAGLWPLALVGAVATVIGAGYYLRVLDKVWFREPTPAFDRAGLVSVATAGVATLLTFPILAFALGGLQRWAELFAKASF